MEEKIKNRIITISGEPVSGKGTTVKLLKQKLDEQGYNVHVISVGDMFREVSIEEFKKEYPEIKNPTIEQVNNCEEFATKRAQIDENIDSYIAKKGVEIKSKPRPNDIYIVDSRLAFSTIPDSFAIRLVVDSRIAGKRVFADKSRGEEDKYENVEQAIEKTAERKMGEIERYKQRYGVDLTDENNYDLIIDTSYATTEDIAKTIIQCEELKVQGQPFSKKWASPRIFLPLQTIRDTFGIGQSGVDLIEFKEIIEKEGYDPKKAIQVLNVDGINYIYEGHHRNFGAAMDGKTLIPYEVIAKDDEQIPGSKNTAKERVYTHLRDEHYYLSSLYDHEEILKCSYAEICGGKYPSIPDKSTKNHGDDEKDR